MINSYVELLDLIQSSFKRVVVTGPQRSSTRFTAKALSHSLSYEYVDEFTHMSWESFLKKPNGVYQTPMHCHYVHEIPKDEETCVVFMQRKISEICESEKRVNWNGFGAEKIAYRTVWPHLDLNKYKCNGEMKQHIWEEFQKPMMKVKFFDFNHSGIKGAPGYITKDKRKHFHACQVK